MNVKEIVTKYLQDNGFDGLRTDGCGCQIADLMPCEDCNSMCEPGYKVPCDCDEGCDFHIVEVK